jgi:hypothetical protein
MDIIPIHPDGLHAVWARVKEGLLKILERSPDDWLPEDVYHALKGGQAQLFICTGVQGLEGFFVLRVVRREFSKVQDMHVWCAHSVGDGDVFDRGLNFVCEAARKAGCQRVTFGSQREGWKKRFAVDEITYRIDLNG